MTIRTAEVVWLGVNDVAVGKKTEASEVNLVSFTFEVVRAVKMAEAAIYTDNNGNTKLIKSKYAES